MARSYLLEIFFMNNYLLKIVDHRMKNHISMFLVNLGFENSYSYGSDIAINSAWVVASELLSFAMNYILEVFNLPVIPAAAVGSHSVIFCFSRSILGQGRLKMGVPKKVMHLEELSESMALLVSNWLLLITFMV